MMKSTFFVSLLCLVFMGTAHGMVQEDKNNPVCIIKTSMGDIFVEIAKEAPDTVKNFIALAEGEKEYTNTVKNSKVKNHFYDNLIFHRVIKNFMIQGGCPLGKGYGGPKNKGIDSFPFHGKEISYPFADEFQSGKKFNKSGILAMANAGANTNGSQFFITHVPTPHLNNAHTIFGEVVSESDQEVVNSVAQGDQILEIKIS